MIVNRENDRFACFIVSPYISTVRNYPQLPGCLKLFFGGYKYSYFCSLSTNRYGLCKEWATLLRSDVTKPAGVNNNLDAGAFEEDQNHDIVAYCLSKNPHNWCSLY